MIYNCSLITVETQTLAVEYESAKAQLEGNDTHTQVGVLYHSSIQLLYGRSDRAPFFSSKLV